MGYVSSNHEGIICSCPWLVAMNTDVCMSPAATRTKQDLVGIQCWIAAPSCGQYNNDRMVKGCLFKIKAYWPIRYIHTIVYYINAFISPQMLNR